MNIMVTGANGFIGKHLCHMLSLYGFQVYGIERKQTFENLPVGINSNAAFSTSPALATNPVVNTSPALTTNPAFTTSSTLSSDTTLSINPTFTTYALDLLNTEQLSEFILAHKINGIIHLANLASPGRDPKQFNQQIDGTIRPNVSLALSLTQDLDFAIFVGSCEEYGNGVSPFVEDQLPQVFSPYGWGKIASLQAVNFILQERKINFCWVRPFLTFGPQQVSQSIIPSTILSCLKNEDIALTPGEQTRDFIYVDDLCMMFKSLIENHQKINGQIFNLCSGIPRTIRSVSELIQNKIGKGSLHFGKIPYRANEAMNFYGSNEKFEHYFGKCHLLDFEEALDKTIDSYKKIQLDIAS